MSSSDSPQGSKHSGISGGALAAAIALPIVLGVALLLAIPFIIARYKRKNGRKNALEYGSGHLRIMSDISETDKPLLMKSPPPSSLLRFYSSPMLPDETTYEYPERPTSARSQNQLPTIALNTMQLSHERLADLGFPMPLPSPPAANSKLPQTHLSLPKSSPHASVSKPMNAIETIDSLRPSFLTKPRPAPVAPGAKMGASRHGRPDMRGALLTRMATKRSRSHGDPTEEDSPVSIYSQASLRRGDTHKFFPKRGGGVDLEAPPVPPLPRPFPDELTSPVVQTRRNSFSGVPSPTRHMFAEEEDPNASSFTVQHRIFLDTALPSPEASLVSNSRWWSNVWGSYIPSSPTNPSPTQTSTGGIGLPVGRRSLAAHRQSTNPTTKDVPWHAMPQYGVVEQAYGNVSGERGQVMIAAFGEGSQGRVERAARRLPPAPSTSS